VRARDLYTAGQEAAEVAEKVNLMLLPTSVRE